MCQQPGRGVVSKEMARGASVVPQPSGELQHFGLAELHRNGALKGLVPQPLYDNLYRVSRPYMTIYSGQPPSI